MTEKLNSGIRKSFRSLACENCRLRKIRCDKTTPCSSCITLGIACKAAVPSARTITAEQQAGVTLPSRYEQKINLLQEQILALQKSVQELSRSNLTARSASPNGARNTPRLAAPIQSASTAPVFEGQSSFNNETLIARDAAYSAVATLPAGGMHDGVSTALLTLKNSLDRRHPSSKTDEAAVPNEGPATDQSDTELLPVDFVVALVKKVKAQPPFCLVSHAWRDHLHVESLCQRIYFPSEPIPAGSIILLHGLLYYIIREYLHEGDSALARFDCASYAALCDRRFSAGLKSYDMLITPTLEKVQALLLGVTKAQEESNLQLCWTYLSVAFNMCQSLGFHRSSALRHDPFPVAEAKRHVFWSLYTIDKNLSLNLGLTSHFQDHDIDTELFTPSDNARQRPWDLMTLVIVKFATIQGQVYDQLYSTSATRTSPDKKLEAIEKLSADLIAVRDELLAIDVTPGLYADSLHGMAACADFITYSVLTVIYRAQTLPTNAMAITSKCLETATLALQSHLQTFTYFRDRKTHKQAEYVNWILLYPSFTPYVIIFTHAIATASTADLTLLQDTVHSLELIKGISRGSAHLHEICKAFLHTAQVLIESRQTFLTGLERHHDGSLVMPSAVDGQTNIALPDVSWPEDMEESNMNSADISVFLNDFLGAGRPVVDLLNCISGD